MNTHLVLLLNYVNECRETERDRKRVDSCLFIFMFPCEFDHSGDIIYLFMISIFLSINNKTKQQKRGILLIV